MLITAKRIFPSFAEKAQQYKTWFYSLNQRERLALQVLGVFLGLLFFYFGIWRPIDSYRAEAEREYQSQAELYEWMQVNESLARQRQGIPEQNSVASVDSSSILATVDNTAQLHNIMLQRYEPSQDNGVRIWLENTSFNDLIVWLNELHTEKGISIQELSIQKEANEGFVNSRIEFVKASVSNL
jgi:general secretion pathway protein M